MCAHPVDQCVSSLLNRAGIDSHREGCRLVQCDINAAMQ